MAAYNFALNDQEMAAVEKFQRKHYKKCKATISTIFTETGIGKKVLVSCPKCGKIKDVSDYSTW